MACGNSIKVSIDYQIHEKEPINSFDPPNGQCFHSYWVLLKDNTVYSTVNNEGYIKKDLAFFSGVGVRNIFLTDDCNSKGMCAVNYENVKGEILMADLVIPFGQGDTSNAVVELGAIEFRDGDNPENPPPPEDEKCGNSNNFRESKCELQPEEFFLLEKPYGEAVTVNENGNCIEVLLNGEIVNTICSDIDCPPPEYLINCNPVKCPDNTCCQCRNGNVICCYNGQGVAFKTIKIS